jgi:hypothetical protein
MIKIARILFFCFVLTSVYSQTNVLDYTMIKTKKITNSEKLKMYFEFIEQNRFTDTIISKNILDDALNWSKTTKDKSIQSIVHSGFCMLNRSNDYMNTNSKITTFHLSEAFKLAKESKDNVAIANAFLEKGMQESSNDKIDIAILSLLQGTTFAEKTKDFHLQSLLTYYLSYLYLKIGDFDNQFKFAQKTEKTALLHNLSNSDKSMAYLAMAESYVSFYTDGLYDDEKTKETKNFDLALIHFNKSIEFSKNK